MSFDDYKIQVLEDDIKRFEQNLKPHWWENIPLLGPIIYSIRLSFKIDDIDRGTLRKETRKKTMIFMLIGLVYIYSLLAILTPWAIYWPNASAVKKCKNIVEEQKAKQNKSNINELENKRSE